MESIGVVTTIIRRPNRPVKNKTSTSQKKQPIQELEKPFNPEIDLKPISQQKPNPKANSQPPQQKFRKSPVPSFFNPIQKNDNVPLQSIPTTSPTEFVIPKPVTSITQRYPTNRPQNVAKPQRPKKESIPTTQFEEIPDQKAVNQEYFNPQRPNQRQPQRRQQSQRNQPQNPRNQTYQQKPTRPTQQEYQKRQTASQNRHAARSLDGDKMVMAMTEAMRVLQRDLGTVSIKKTTPKKTLTENRQKFREQRIPNSLNEILLNLEQIDLNIEASALVDIKGTILAAAVSRRISEYLISTIANTLGNIGTDMIHSLESGELNFATLHGTEGILFLAPVMKNVFLLLLTGPAAKIGVINIAKMKVKKQLELFFAKKNLKKTPV